MENHNFDVDQSKPSFNDKLDDLVYFHPWKCAFGTFVLVVVVLGTIWTVAR